MYSEPCGNTQAEIDRDHTPKRVIDSSADDIREPCESIEDIRYSNIVWRNTVAGLLAGAELTARNGKTKYSLADVDTRGMDKTQIEREAGILASYIVGWNMFDNLVILSFYVIALIAAFCVVETITVLIYEFYSERLQYGNAKVGHVLKPRNK